MLHPACRHFVINLIFGESCSGDLLSLGFNISFSDSMGFHEFYSLNFGTGTFQFLQSRPQCVSLLFGVFQLCQDVTTSKGLIDRGAN